MARVVPFSNGASIPFPAPTPHPQPLVKPTTALHSLVETKAAAHHNIFPKSPVFVGCPFCGRFGKTKVKLSEMEARLSIFRVLDWLRQNPTEATHSCSSCGQKLGGWKRIKQ